MNHIKPEANNQAYFDPLEIDQEIEQEIKEEDSKENFQMKFEESEFDDDENSESESQSENEAYDSNEYQCKTCKRAYKYKRGLVSHLKNCKGPKKVIKCDFCLKILKTHKMLFGNYFRFL